MTIEGLIYFFRRSLEKDDGISWRQDSDGTWSLKIATSFYHGFKTEFELVDFLVSKVEI